MIITMLCVGGSLVQSSRDARDARGDLRSVLNRVDHKLLDKNNASFPHLPVLQQWVELRDDHCLYGVYSVGDHRPPIRLATVFDGFCLDNL